MATRRDVDGRVGHERGMVAAGQVRLRKLWPRLARVPVEQARQVLASELVAILEEFGELAALAAADWYAQMRARETGGDYEPVVYEGNRERVLRYGEEAARLLDGTLAGHEAAWRAARAALDRHVHYASQATVARNATHDSEPPRFARVPSGGRTCAFCAMLASRGFVYHTRESAGVLLEYHENCRCQIVPEWEKTRAHVEGYDPDRWYAQYLQARGDLADEGIVRPSTEQILQQMRRSFPSEFTDGVHEKPQRTWSQEFPGRKQSPKARVRSTHDTPELWRRQLALKSETFGERLEEQELEFVEKMEKLGHILEWIPKDTSESHRPTNDFIWVTRDSQVCELKCTSAKYATISRRIHQAVLSASKHPNGPVIKDVFVIDIGHYRLSTKLEHQLGLYNVKKTASSIRALYVLSDDGKDLREISLRKN